MKPPTDLFPKLRRLARIVRRQPPESFDLRERPHAFAPCRCALGVAREYFIRLSDHDLCDADVRALFNTQYLERRRIKPISWYSRVMRFIKRKEAQQCQHA